MSWTTVAPKVTFDDDKAGEYPMEKGERSDPTFGIFVVLAAFFIVVVMYATFPRQEAQAPASSKVTEF
jgi:hypothetical protein